MNEENNSVNFLNETSITAIAQNRNKIEEDRKWDIAILIVLALIFLLITLILTIGVVYLTKNMHSLNNLQNNLDTSNPTIESCLLKQFSDLDANCLAIFGASSIEESKSKCDTVNPSLSDNCYLYIALVKEDNTICNNIVDSKIKARCLVAKRNVV